MKKICLLQLLLMAAIIVCAQPTKILVWLTNGQKVSYNLSERPTMTVENDNVRLKSKTVDLLYAVTDIQRVTFDDQTDGIESATTTNKSGNATLTQESMTFTYDYIVEILTFELLFRCISFCQLLLLCTYID